MTRATAVWAFAVALVVLMPADELRSGLVVWATIDILIAPGARRLQARGVLPVPYAALIIPDLPACTHATCTRGGWFRDPIDGTRLCAAHVTPKGDHHP